MSEQNKNNQSREFNPLLIEISDNLNTFIENINCLRETFGYSEATLRLHKIKSTSECDEIIGRFKNEKTGDIDVPIKYYRDIISCLKRKKRAERAINLIPPSYLVTLVSLFDQFIAGLVRIFYRISPEKLLESGKTFSYRDLCSYRNIQEVKILIIDEIIEGLLRDSHVEQINWLEKAMNVTTLKRFPEWPAFVELTERRNLFVHSDGVVSQQYIDVCNKHNALTEVINKGTQINVDSIYFEKSYKTLYIVSVKISQMLAHTVYSEHFPDDIASIDQILISNVYDMISEELYDVAISVSEFAIENHHFIHNAHDKGYIILNLAQSYKWIGKQDDCRKLLSKEDTTAWKDELLIPKYVLEDNFEAAYVKMTAVGSVSEILTAENYRQWPIFKEIRKEQKFCSLFKDIFGEELEISPLNNMDDGTYNESESTTVSSDEINIVVDKSCN